MIFLGLPIWLWWVALTVLLVIADLTLLGSQFILFGMAVAALITAAVAAFDIEFKYQLWTFIIATLILMPTMIYLFRKRFNPKTPGPRGVGWEKGLSITVVKDGKDLLGKLQGDLYPIKLLDGSAPVEGEQLIIERMEGITLYVFRSDLNNQGAQNERV